tara:strand:+ start:260 stop:514 length:255 start_codon:yes stop_codon:yes gene_type:complete
MGRKNYIYHIQFGEEDDVICLDTMPKVVEYLNKKYNMPYFSRDMIRGWFRGEDKRKNVLLKNIKSLERIELPRKHPQQKGKAKL